MRYIINLQLSSYQLEGLKYFLFTNNQDRAETLRNLTDELKPLMIQNYNPNPIKEVILKLINAKNQTLQSHRENSCFGKMEITHSRLVRYIDQIIRKLVTEKFFTQDELDSIIQENKKLEKHVAVRQILI